MGFVEHKADDDLRIKDRMSNNSLFDSPFITFKLNIPVMVRIIPAMDDFGDELYTHTFKEHVVTYFEFDETTQQNKKILKYVYCPRNEKKPCGLCDAHEKIIKFYIDTGKKYKDLLKQASALGFEAKNKTLVRVLERGDDELTPKFLEYKKAIAEEVMKYTSKGILNIKNGMDIEITKILKDDSKPPSYMNIKYDVTVGNPSPICRTKDELKQIIENAQPYSVIKDRNKISPEELKELVIKQYGRIKTYIAKLRKDSEEE